MKKQPYLILAIIVIIGLLVRLWQVDGLPKILNRDEAALAYNAYLISQTGKDEFGRSLPFTFESFGDYKLPGYVYTLAGLFKVLPVNDFVVRLPSVIAGTWLIIAGFWLAKNFKFSDNLALIFALTISLNPVFWFYSRIAFEANVALAFFTTALVFFTTPKPTIKSDLGGTLLTIAALLFYNTPLLLLPFLGISLVIARGVTKPKKWLPVGFLLTIVFVFFYWQLSTLTAQKSGITWFSDETTWDESVKYYNQFSGLEQKIVGNRFVFFGKKIVPKIIASFSPKFLVTTGGSHPWHTLPGWGHLYWSTYIFGLVGLMLTLMAAKADPKIRGLILLLFFALIPSVITVDAPHATRSLLFLLLFTLMSVFTLQALPKKLSHPLMVLFVVCQFLGATFYGYHYFFIFPENQPQSLQVGFEQAIQKIEQSQPTAKVAIVDESGYQYILTAWYLKLEPNLFLSTIIKQLPTKIGFKYGQQVSHYHFIAQEADRDPSETILLEWKDNLWQSH